MSLALRWNTHKVRKAALALFGVASGVVVNAISPWIELLVLALVTAGVWSVLRRSQRFYAWLPQSVADWEATTRAERKEIEVRTLGLTIRVTLVTSFVYWSLGTVVGSLAISAVRDVRSLLVVLALAMAVAIPVGARALLRRRSALYRPPLVRTSRLLQWLCPPRAYDGVIEPLMAEYQEECVRCYDRGQVWRARYLHALFYASLLRSVILLVVRSIFDAVLGSFKAG